MLTFQESKSQAIVAKLMEKDEWIKNRIIHELELMGNDDTVLSELQLMVSTRDIVEGTTKEISFARFHTSVDAYGLPINTTRKCVINGGWINHGTVEKPDWSSHT
jgi:hypothetical protein